MQNFPHAANHKRRQSYLIVVEPSCEMFSDILNDSSHFHHDVVVSNTHCTADVNIL